MMALTRSLSSFPLLDTDKVVVVGGGPLVDTGKVVVVGGGAGTGTEGGPAVELRTAASVGWDVESQRALEVDGKVVL